MARKTRLSAASNATCITQSYISTSEVIKTRARGRREISKSCVESSPLPETFLKESDDKPQTYQSIVLAHLDELAKIWDIDKRIPSVPSRRAWALARNLKPEHVHRWWHRRKKVAKKARIRIPSGTYELPVGTPPVIEQPVKEEPDATQPSRKLPRVSNCTPDPQDSSDQVSTIVDSTYPSSDGFGVFLSSDTVVARCQSSQFNHRWSAYSPYKPPPALFLDHDMASKYSDTMNHIPSSSPLPPSSPVSASSNSCANNHPASMVIDKIANASQLICNQGTNMLSYFTCPLCTNLASSSGALNRNFTASSYEARTGIELTTSFVDLEPSHSTNHIKVQPTNSPPEVEHSVATSKASNPIVDPLDTLPPRLTTLDTFSDFSAHVFGNALWCFDGRKYSYDGFFLGICSCLKEYSENHGCVTEP